MADDLEECQPEDLPNHETVPSDQVGKPDEGAFWGFALLIYEVRERDHEEGGHKYMNDFVDGLKRDGFY